MYMQRKRMLFLYLILMSVTINLQSQDTSSERNSLKAGAWALQFGISSNFTLTSFQGSNIAFKYQLSDKSALRGGITINGSTNDGTTSNSGSIDDTSYGTAPGSSSTESATASFVLQYLWYMNPNGPVHFYTGLGPLVSYSYSKYSTNNPYSSTVYDSGSYRGY